MTERHLSPDSDATEIRMNPKQWITRCIEEYCAGPANSLNFDNEPAWGAPLVGFASGSDPLFAEIRESIGEFYWTPETAFAQAFPSVPAEELTVVSWILPQTTATKKENRKETEHPGKRWLLSRKFGEDFNFSLHDHLSQTLCNAKINTVAPVRLPAWKVHPSEKFVASASWSERHAAYVAGLGTFGLCDGLITPVGKAMRCGSIITHLQIDPNPRPYDDIHAYCLHFMRGTCGACIRRCPANAISIDGHDKRRCREFVAQTIAYAEKTLNLTAYGCGLCQVRVPCESGIPKELKPQSETDGTGENRP